MGVRAGRCGMGIEAVEQVFQPQQGADAFA
jgi:hypothetical protein